MISSRSLPATTWALQASYVVAEVAVGLRVSGGYSFVDHTISDLGATTCRSLADGSSGGVLVVCSPWHTAMNVAFVLFGLSLALGAWQSRQLRHLRGTGRLLDASVALWVVAGASSVAVGLTPIDVHPDLHAAVAVGVFAAQPLALVLLGLALRTTRPGLGRASVAVGALSAVGSIGFLLLLHADEGAGAFERLALWPGYVWVCVLAWTLGVRRTAAEPGVAPTR